MAETEGISRILYQPALPEASTAPAQYAAGDLQTEMMQLRQTVGSDLQGMRDYLRQQQLMLRDMYHTISQQINELLVLTRIAEHIPGVTVDINSTSPITMAQITVFPTADSRVLVLGFCESLLFSGTAQHDLIFEIHKGTVGGGVLGLSRTVDSTLVSNEWTTTVRAIDESPTIGGQTYILTGKKEVAGDANTQVVNVLFLGLNMQKVEA